MRALLLATIVILAGCTSQTVGGPDPLPEPGLEAVRFLVVGDTGTGAAGQQKVADAMENVCIDLGCDFVLLLGDAIYEYGVTSVDDPQFISKFEVPYSNFSIPFYVVLGNHDYGGTPKTYDAGRASHYLDYADHSPRWRMPGMTYVVDTGPIDLFALDSSSLVVHGSPSVPPGSSLAQQKAWLASAIAASDAPWKMTFAHHAFISNGHHGDAGRFDGTAGLGAAWKDLLASTACGKVDFHLAGHDHDLQWLKPVSACGDTAFIVSGAGAKQRAAGTGLHAVEFQAFSTYGFVWMQADDDQLAVRFYDGDGGVMFQDTRTKA